MYYLRDFDEISRLSRKYNIAIDINNSNNDDNLVWTAAELLDKECLQFCLENGARIENLSYACRKVLTNYEQNPAKTIELIDYLILQGADIWDVFHYSLVWKYIDVHKHIITKWLDQIDFNWVICALEMSARQGSYESVKYILENEIYREIITPENFRECLIEAISVDTYCNGHRYNLVKYLVNTKKAVLDDHMMELIEYFLSHYSAENLDKNFYGRKTMTCENWDYEDENYLREKWEKWEKENHLYMPDLFKYNKILIVRDEFQEK